MSLLFDFATKNLHLATSFYHLVAKWRLNIFFNFEPCGADFYFHNFTKRKFLNLANYFPYDVKLRILAHSRSFLANQKARNAIFGAENLLINNYLPKWRWLVVDIYRAAKRRGKYQRLATDTEVNSCFSIY